MFKVILKFGCALVVCFYFFFALYIVPEIAGDYVNGCSSENKKLTAYCECVYRPYYDNKFQLTNAMLYSMITGDSSTKFLRNFKNTIKERPQVCKPYLPAETQLGNAFIGWLTDQFK